MRRKLTVKSVLAAHFYNTATSEHLRYMEINRFTLPNGLKVIHSFDEATAMVAVNTLYGVGGKDENDNLTGIAHLFEHLMFGGSVNIEDFDSELSAAGGVSNAWTSNDFTNFYDTLPAVNLETALWLESDRMMQLAFSDHALDVQRSVVIEEFKQMCLNRPYGDMDHALHAMAYTCHPYRYPVIGKDFSHIEKVTQDDVRNWFYSHYAPNNATLAICGNVSFERAKEAVEKWYGDIPKREIAPRLYSPEPLPLAPRKVEMSGNVPQTLITLAFPMVGYAEEGYFDADILSDILANGQASRFYRRLLLDSDIFTDIDASISGTEDPGLFLISAKLRENGYDAEQRAIDAINAELELLCKEPVDNHSMQRCVNRVESTRTFSLLGYLAQAQTFAYDEMHGADPNDFMAPYRAITPESLQKTAQNIFNPNRLFSLIYRPE